MKPRLAEKLETIRRGGDAFILADARDADMAWGLAAPGPSRAAGAKCPWRSMPEFRDEIRGIVDDAQVDLMLASVSQMSVLAHREKIFEASTVTPAIRANDTTDIWLPRGGRYREKASRPFATCNLREAQYDGARADQAGDPVVNLGLYSITFTNDRDADRESLEAFKRFRDDAAACGFRYFLEIFEPNLEGTVAPGDLPHFLNDQICRILAGVSVGSWPEFLKVPFLDGAAMRDLADYDPEHLVVGVLGGASGTTHDAFALLDTAKRHGARAALFGRRIKDAEHPVEFVRHLRRVADGECSPEDAVRRYHETLAELGTSPRRPLAQDLEITLPSLHRQP